MSEFSDFRKTIKTLRSPQGCPWDREQTHSSLKPYLLEESYEVLEAIDQNDPVILKDELGDLLLQVFLHAQIAEEHKQFNITDILENINQKMIRRHPHVFADAKVENVKDVWHNWEKIKKDEKKDTLIDSAQDKSIMDTVPAALPALYRASKVQKKAARLGFDWPDNQGVLDKISEEVAEFKSAASSHDNQAQIEEFGDILFSLVNFSRKLNIDAEDALRLATKKFEKRFKFIEKKVNSSPKEFTDYSLEELETYWQESKKTIS